MPSWLSKARSDAAVPKTTAGDTVTRFKNDLRSRLWNNLPWAHSPRPVPGYSSLPLADSSSPRSYLQVPVEHSLQYWYLKVGSK